MKVSGPKQTGFVRHQDGSCTVTYEWEWEVEPSWMRGYAPPWKWLEIGQREGIRQAVDAWENEGGR